MTRAAQLLRLLPDRSAANPLKLVLPAYGAAEVHVTQGGVAALNARVTVSGGGRSVSVFTDAGGVGVARGIPLETVSVQAVTVDGAFSGSASATISSQSTPAVVNIALGAFAGISGLVDAETAGLRSDARGGHRLQSPARSDHRLHRPLLLPGHSDQHESRWRTSGRMT